VKLLRTLKGLTSVLLLILVGAQLSVHQVGASQTQTDYWYVETLKLGDVELPEGVEIMASDPSVQPRGMLTLNNQSSAPLYVMSLNYKDVLVMTTPDPNWKNRVNGAHEAASYLAAPGRTVTLDMVALSDLDKRLVDRNVFSNDPPPESLPVPAAQSSELLLVYREQVIEVPFTLTYSHNSNFDNKVEGYEQPVMNAQAAGDANSTEQEPAGSASWGITLLIGLGGVTFLAVSGWLIWKRLRRSR
jgi:hypothetical protein